jgi:hypothetical protein
MKDNFLARNICFEITSAMKDQINHLFKNYLFIVSQLRVTVSYSSCNLLFIVFLLLIHTLTRWPTLLWKTLKSTPHLLFEGHDAYHLQSKTEVCFAVFPSGKIKLLLLSCLVQMLGDFHSTTLPVVNVRAYSFCSGECPVMLKWRIILTNYFRWAQWGVKMQAASLPGEGQWSYL